MVTILLWLLLPTISAYNIPLLYYNDSYVDEIMPRILYRYNHTLVLHFDAATNLFGRTFPQSIYCFNYDLSTYQKRPSGNSYVHIIDSNVLIRKDNFFQIEVKVNKRDTVIIMERDIKIPRKLLNLLYFAKALFVVKVKKFQLFHCTFQYYNQICVKKQIGPKENLQYLPKAHRAKYLKPKVVGYCTSHPYIYIKNNKLAGLESRLIGIVGSYLNFSYSYLSYDNKSITGNKVEAMLDDVFAGKTSWGMGQVVLNEVRLERFEGTTTFYLDGYSAIYNYELIMSSSKQLIYTTLFQLISITIGMFVGGVVYIYIKLFRTRLGLHYIIMLIFAPLLDQTYSTRKIKGITLRTLFVAWWLTCYISTIRYKTYLLSTLVRGSDQKYTIEDLLDRGFDFQCVQHDYFFIKSECKRNPSSICSDMIPRLSFFHDICNMTNAMLKSKVALVGETFTLNSLFIKSCSLAMNDIANIKFVESKLFGTQMHYWPLLRNSVLMEPFNRVIKILDESGIFANWLNIEMDHVLKLTAINQPLKLDIIELNDIYFPLCLLIIGYFVAMVVFVQEVYYS